MPTMKRTIKDSVFSYLFHEPRYTKRLYQSLHPEDADVREEDIHLLTLSNILTNGPCSDLGFQVRNRVIILLEAQPTLSVNLALRFLFYTEAIYKDYVEEKKLDLYGPKPITIPSLEAYAIYTGEQPVPDSLHFSDLFQGDCPLKLEVKVLRGKARGKDDIICQYVRFCQIADEQQRKYGPTQKAVEATIQLCLEEDILVPFLLAKKEELLRSW